jgi:hypothetical protein
MTNSSVCSASEADLEQDSGQAGQPTAVIGQKLPFHAGNLLIGKAASGLGFNGRLPSS